MAAALDPIVTIDARGIIQSASDSVERVLGWTPAELLGRNVSVLMPEPHHSAHDGYLEKYHRTGQTNILNRPRRFDARRKDGTLLPIELCVSRAEMPAGQPPLFVGLIRDMSVYAEHERNREVERVRWERTLAEQTSALQAAHMKLRLSDRLASIGTLAAGLGHDMNNVLLPVRARLNALRAACGETGEPRDHRAEREHLDEIRKSVAYLQQLADGLHFLAMDPDAEDDLRSGVTTDLPAWWAQTGALLSKAVPKHVRVSATFPEGLPPVALAAHGLTQAVLNLVVNAGEAIPPAGQLKRRQGHVRVRAALEPLAPGAKSAPGAGPAAAPAASPAPALVRLSVSDNGVGMTPEVRRRAFEMFFTTKTRGLGTGLGLALVRKVAERAGGRVEIDSTPGQGSSVSMLLPVAVATSASIDALPRDEAAISIADGRAATLVGHLLEHFGFTPVQRDDPGAARAWIVQPTPQTLAQARAWRTRHPHEPLILFGKADPRSKAAWGQLHPAIIEQPTDLDAVRSTLRSCLPVP